MSAGLILGTTARSLEMLLSGVPATNQLVSLCSYADTNQDTHALIGQDTERQTTNSGTAVTILSAPVASTTRRRVKYLSIPNIDTAAVTLTLQWDDTGVKTRICKFTLAVDDVLLAMDGCQPVVINSSGQIKTALSGAYTATRVLFGAADGNPTTDAGFVFNTTGDILTVGAINLAGSTAPTIGFYTPSANQIRTPNNVTADGSLTHASP